MGYKLNGCNTGGLPMYLIKPLLEKYKIPFFVETGTAGGESVRTASPYFKHCYTIELIKGRPNKDIINKNVDYLIGDSVELLPNIISELNDAKSKLEPINHVEQKQFVLFWLDAHYSDEVPNTSNRKECPILEEIQAVSAYGDDAIIFIDDARLFLGSVPYPCNPKDWCSISDIFVKLTNCFPYHYHTLTDDYIISIPIHVKEVIDKEWRDRFSERYPSEKEKIRVELKHIYNEFLNYIK
jgi:hypothetical protein